MSLAEAVLQVAEAMEKESQEKSGEKDFVWDACVRSMLRSFARELRTAVKASEHAPAQEPLTLAQFASPETQHRHFIEQAKKEFQKAQREENSERLVAVQGGPLDGVLVPIEASMPPGARTLLEGSVYTLQQDGLVFDPGGSLPGEKF